MILAVHFPLAALLAAVGLYSIAPRRTPLLYLGPATFTLAVLAAASLYVATIWSH